MITSGRRLAGWAVHLYTALGSIIGLLALLAGARGDIQEAFLWLCAAIAIDASDGALARFVGVKEVVPEYNGAELDDIVDYLNFVVVPVFLMLQIGLLAGPFGYLTGGAALLASAYRFCHADAKTPDHFFTGFPSYWNIIAFYLYVFDVGPGTGAVVTGVLAVLVFAPLRFVYPSRTVFLRPLTIGLGVVWAVLGLMTLAALPEKATGLAAASLFYPAYYTGLSFYMQATGKDPG
ncbi:MAG: CDP-diacylglycerol O-phosphatidyltransferase [Candidatus Binatia bacterium]|nr:CDP-diacylglycerol O-phosphatidyltransferase [Candidatus Binatia bacterium]